ncbi:hypothetical protein BC940DRAFT_334092 [Gongronella butleri]|nr:hypothetical protein BC940DRAFT_334092 [Gongronella butleri]
MEERQQETGTLPSTNEQHEPAAGNGSTPMDDSQQTSPLSCRNGNKSNSLHKKQSSELPKEDTFYQSLQIRLHHSVGSLSISPTCRDVVLAGRQGLVIIDLENPWLIPRILPHMSKWEVSDIQWSPYVCRDAWVASTSNQKLLIWNLSSSSQPIEHTLNAHARAISDINWSPHHPDIVATCAVDTYVRVWDLRCAGQSYDHDHYYRAANSFTPWNAAATQVKFNFKNEHLIASSHDKEVKIWDMRKGAVPVTSITAHSKKIYGIDWSRQNDHDIVTCSLDMLVKHWNIHTPEEAEETIVTNSPVWRARNTPFGHGILTMPQRSESTLQLYNRATPDKPVHLFEGHTNTVKEFVWRWKGGLGDDGDDREFQLVTWSKDQNLRLWPVSSDIMKAVGHRPSDKKTCYRVPSVAVGKDGSYHSHSYQEAPVEDVQNDARSRSIAEAIAPVKLFSLNTQPFNNLAPGNVHYSRSYNLSAASHREQKYTINPLLWMQNVKTISTGPDLNSQPATFGSSYQSLQDELSTVLNKYASVGVKTEKINAAARTCTVSLHGPWTESGTAFLRITIRFSQQYPDNSAPEFDIQKNSMISIYYRTHMAQDLNALAASYTSKKQWCLEPCLRYLLGETMHDDESRLSKAKAVHNAASNASSTAVTPTTPVAPATEANGMMPPLPEANGTETELSAADGMQPAYSAWTAEHDSDDDIFVPSLMPTYGIHGKRGSIQSENGIVDLSSRQSADTKVPFPRLCGGVFSGNGQLVCFFSTLRLRDPNSNKRAKVVHKGASPSSSASNAEYFEHTYHDFYKHPRSYEQFEEYKEIAAMSRQGRHAGVMVDGSGAFGEYDDDPDDIDDGLANMDSIYFKTDMLDPMIKTTKYHGSEADRFTHDVCITDCTHLLPLQLDMTKDLRLLPHDPIKACGQNAALYKKHERTDVARMWMLAMEILRECVPLDLPSRMNQVFDLVHYHRPDLQIIASDPMWLRDSKLAEINELLGRGYISQSPDVNNEQTRKRRVRWGAHPFGRQLVLSMIDHAISIGDIQTAALLACTFSELPAVSRPSFKGASLRAKNTISLPPVLPLQPPPPPAAVREQESTDYFSWKKPKPVSHTLAQQQARTKAKTVQADLSTGNTGSTSNTTAAATSSTTNSSSKTNFLSYFWDSKGKPAARPLVDSPRDVTPAADKADAEKEDGDDEEDGAREVHKVTTAVQPWAMATYSGLTMPTNTMPGLRSSPAAGLAQPLSMSQQSRNSFGWTPPFNTIMTPTANMSNSNTTPITPPSIAATAAVTAAAAAITAAVPPPGAIPLSSTNVVPHAVTVTSKEGDVLANDPLSIEFTNVECFDSEKMFIYNPMPLIPPDKIGACDMARWQYADILYRQGLLNERAEVLQAMHTQFLSKKQQRAANATDNPQIHCYMCHQPVAGSDRVCHQCRKIRTQIKCTICHQLVRGLLHFCLQCKHGGHEHHIKEWFANEKVCPTGCGCQCLKETKSLYYQLNTQHVSVE